MTWAEMTPAQRGQTLRNMARFGGSFVKALAAAWLLADPENDQALGAAFPAIVNRYAAMVPA